MGETGPEEDHSLADAERRVQNGYVLSEITQEVGEGPGVELVSPCPVFFPHHRLVVREAPRWPATPHKSHVQGNAGSSRHAHLTLIGRWMLSGAQHLSRLETSHLSERRVDTLFLLEQ